jgi:hypothetical protein
MFAANARKSAANALPIANGSAIWRVRGRMPQVRRDLPADGGRVRSRPRGGTREADMNDDEKIDQKRAEPPTFAAEDVRQGEIILKHRWQRLVFIGGLVAVVLVILLLRFAG